MNFTGRFFALDPKIRKRYRHVPHLTRDTFTPYGKVTKTQENKTQESQEVSSFQAGDHKAARNSQDSITKTNMNIKKDLHKKPCLKTVSKNNHMFNHTNLTLSSWHAIKEESEVVNRDLVDLQACSVLQ